MRTTLCVLACLGLGGTAAFGQSVVCDPLCRDPSTTAPYGGGSASSAAPFQNTNSNKNSATSSAKASSSSSSRSQATGSIAGTQVNAPISSKSQGGSASVTVINTTTAANSNRQRGSGGSGWGRSGGYYGSGATTTASDPPAVAADPPQLGSPQLPLTTNSTNTVGGTETIRTPPEIVAPNISGGNPCLVGISGGGSGPGIGITLGIGYSDKGCERRNNAAILNNIGEKNAAIELMCDDEHVREALARAGHPCEQDRARTATPVATAPTPTTVARATAVDPAIIRRQQEVPLQEVATVRPKAPRYPDWCYTASALELRQHPECQPH